LRNKVKVVKKICSESNLLIHKILAIIKIQKSSILKKKSITINKFKQESRCKNKNKDANLIEEKPNKYLKIYASTRPQFKRIDTNYKCCKN
jgi:hypothetical protein